MGRKLGSKNKLKEPKEQNNDIALNQTSIEESETIEQSVKKKRHRRTKAEMELYRASLKAQEEQKQENQEIQENQKDVETQDNITNFKIEASESIKVETDILKEPDIPEEKEIIKNAKFTSSDISKSINKSKPKNKTTTFPKCDCCANEIYCQPHRIDTNIISAQVADYYRESPRWINLCSKCAQKLSSVVDKWLQENGCITRMEQRILEKEENTK